MSNVQFDYSTLSTSISRSELSSIINRHIVDNEYDINEEASSEGSSNTSEIFVRPLPPDRYKLVYLTFGLLGIGTLLPWNFFITANDFWMYKFRDTVNSSCIHTYNKTDLQAAFTSYLAVSNNVPYVIFLVLCTIFNNRFSKNFRVLIPLFVMLLLFAIVTTCVELNTDSWQMGFFSLVILIIITLGVVGGLLSAGVTGIASLLPAKYMHILVLGQAVAGVLAAVFQILSLLGHCDSIKSALIYFLAADIVIVFTLFAYMGIQKSEFFNYHMNIMKDSTVMKDVVEPQIISKVATLVLLKQIWPYAVSVLIVFWVTIGIFPGLSVLAMPMSHGSLWDGKLFLPLTCFLVFNISDLSGRAVGGWLPLPQSRRTQLLILCISRVAFIPLIMMCNLHPRHNLPVTFSSDAYYIAFMTLLGFTNGYCVASAMLIGVKSVSPSLQEQAGVILSAFLGAGLMLGAFTSFICIHII